MHHFATRDGARFGRATRRFIVVAAAATLMLAANVDGASAGFMTFTDSAGGTFLTAAPLTGGGGTVTRDDSTTYNFGQFNPLWGTLLSVHFGISQTVTDESTTAQATCFTSQTCATTVQSQHLQSVTLNLGALTHPSSGSTITNSAFCQESVPNNQPSGTCTGTSINAVSETLTDNYGFSAGGDDLSPFIGTGTFALDAALHSSLDVTSDAPIPFGQSVFDWSGTVTVTYDFLTADSVAEPGSALLLVGGIGLMAAARRRRATV